MGDEKLGVIGTLQGVYAMGDDFQGVNVETGIGFIEDGELRFQHRHLKNLVALFFATGKAFVDGALEQGVVEVEQFHFFSHKHEEVRRIEFGLPPVFLEFIVGGLEKIGAVHARNFDRILKGEKK